MKLTYLNQWLSDREINVICWMLIHSLWIGLAIAVLAGIIIACTRKATGNLRYRLFCGLLIAFVIVMAGLAIVQMSGNEDAQYNVTLLVSAVSQTLGEDNLVVHPVSSFQRNLVDLLDQNAVWIFALWSICFLFKSMRLIAEVFYIRRIRTCKIQGLNEEWSAKVKEFSNRMGIKKQVSIIQSALVKVPAAIGYLKPVIVLPLGLICQLPAAQVETILWHELAHIYRRDYIVNILQRMVEAIFFFNPAILWLSTLIREEREACCDEIVVENVEHKANYLQALAAFHMQKSGVGGLAIGLSLRPNQLINRLKRMVNKENKRLSTVELAVLVAGSLILSAFTFIPQVKPGIKDGAVYIKKAVSETLSITAPEQSQSSKPTARAFRPPVTILPDKKDGIEIDTLIKFKSVRFKNSNEDKANMEVNVIDGQDNRYHIIVADGKLILVEFNEQAVAANEFSKFENLLAQIDYIMQQKFVNPSPQYVKENKFSKDNTTDAQIPKKKLPLIDASADKARILGVMAALVEQKVVPDDSSIDWFALTEDQLVVNGQKQDGQLHQQLKAKYSVRPDNGLFFGPSKVHGTGIFFDRSEL